MTPKRCDMCGGAALDSRWDLCDACLELIERGKADDVLGHAYFVRDLLEEMRTGVKAKTIAELEAGGGI